MLLYSSCAISGFEVKNRNELARVAVSISVTGNFTALYLGKLNAMVNSLTRINGFLLGHLGECFGHSSH